MDAALKRFFDGKKKQPSSRIGGILKLNGEENIAPIRSPTGEVRLDKNPVRLPGSGWMKFDQYRPSPDGFKIWTGTGRRQTDGFYISVHFRDAFVPSIPSPNPVITAVGVDLGIAKLASLRRGETLINTC